MKKNKDKIKFGILATLAVCLLTGSISGTYAKYTSEKASSDTVTVARWAFDVNDKNIARETFNFNLFEDKELVAPGDTGSFTFTLENTSDVNAKYTINYDISNESTIPLLFSIDDGNTWLPEIDPSTDIKISSGGTKTETVKWKWETSSDSEDTEFGNAENLASITVKATVTATQDI